MKRKPKRSSDISRCVEALEHLFKDSEPVQLSKREEYNLRRRIEADTRDLIRFLEKKEKFEKEWSRKSKNLRFGANFPHSGSYKRHSEERAAEDSKPEYSEELKYSLV